MIEFICNYIGGFEHHKIIYIALFILLIVSAITDIKNREIPIHLCFVCIVFTIMFYIYFKINAIEYIVVAIALGAIYFMMCAITGSGGDVIMMALVGFCLGMIGSLAVIALASLYTLIYALFLMLKKKNIREIEYPLAPFVLGGYITYLLVIYKIV